MPKCQWFLKCKDKADKQVEHPTLGWVDICDSHIEWLKKNMDSNTVWIPPMVAKKAVELRKKMR